MTSFCRKQSLFISRLPPSVKTKPPTERVHSIHPVMAWPMNSSTVDSIHRILLFYVPQSLVLDSSFFGDTANELLGRETPDEVGRGLYGCLLSKSIKGSALTKKDGRTLGTECIYCPLPARDGKDDRIAGRKNTSVPSSH